MTFLFVPVLGQILAALISLLVLYYLWLRRSFKLTFAVGGGAALALLLLLIVTRLIPNHLDVVLFILMGTGIPVCIFLLIGVGFLIWRATNIKTNSPTPTK